MKNKLIYLIVLMTSVFMNNVTYAQNVSHTFNYQGELIDNGPPANGDYDITIQGYETLEGNLIWGDLSTHLNITVTNGLFNIKDVDLGLETFDGLDLYLEISVRMGGGNPVYETLSPRQKLAAVPYATNLVKGNAVNGQVYTYSDNKWQALTNEHFSGDFTDLINVPADIADGDSDTTYLAGAGISIVDSAIINTGDTDASDDVTSLDGLTDVIASDENLFVGDQSGKNTIADFVNGTGQSNTAFGIDTLRINISGGANSAFGKFALRNNISGSRNSAFGSSALSVNNGELNVAFGAFALQSNLNNNNTAIGSFSGFNNINGNGNIFIGKGAGYFETGSNKLYIENTNSVAPLIGGDFDANEVIINGKLGIGTDAPDETMHLKGSFHQKFKIESLDGTGSASVRLQTNAAAFDYLDIEKYGSNSGATSAGIPLAGISRISAGANAGPLMLQVINSNLPMYFVTNNTLQMTLEGDGDLKLEEKLTAPDSGGADMKAYIYMVPLVRQGLLM